MRLNLEQQQRVEDVLREKGEHCDACGSDFRSSGEVRPAFLGGGFIVEVRCPNAGAEDHAGGFDLHASCTLSSEEARRIGIAS